MIAASGNVNLRVNGHDYRDPFGNTIPLGTIFDPRTTQFNVPCNAALSQDCGGNGALVTYRAPFVGNVVPSSLIDKVSATILNKYVPLPQGPNAAAGTLTSNYLNPFHGCCITRLPAVKTDQNIGSRARVAFTYSDNHTESPVQALGLGEGFPEPITANAGTFEASPTLRLNFDYNLRPTMLFHLGAGFHNAASDIGLTGANSIFQNPNQPACQGPCLPSGLWTYHGPNEAGNPTRGSLNSRLTDALLPAGSCRPPVLVCSTG